MASVAASELAPQGQRGKAMAVVLGGMTLSFIAGIPAGSLIGDFTGWRGTFAYAATVATLAALIVGMVLPRMPGHVEPAFSMTDLASKPGIAAPLALTFLGFAATFAVVAYLGPLVTAITGLKGSGIGAIQACIGIGSIVGIVIGARFADKPAASTIMMTTFVTSAISLSAVSLLFHTSGVVATLGLVVAIAAGAAALFCRTPLIQARLVNEAPAQRPVLLALNGSMVFFGQGLGAALGGIVIGFAGLPYVGWIGGILALASAAIASITRVDLKRRVIRSLIDDNAVAAVAKGKR